MIRFYLAPIPYRLAAILCNRRLPHINLSVRGLVFKLSVGKKNKILMVNDKD